MAVGEIKELLEAGVHFGHQTKRWNPKMKPYIFGERNGIYIIDLEKTTVKLKEACEFLRDLAANGGKVLFVGTKKQAQEIVREQATRCKMFYATDRWLGGTLTNFETIKEGIHRHKELTALREDPEKLSHYTKKERAVLEKERGRLQKNLGGIVGLEKRPDCVIVVDSKKEEIAVEEANRLEIPIVGLVDTNCDPDKISHVIPGNDDAIKSIKLVITLLSESILEGVNQYELAHPPPVEEKKVKEVAEKKEEEKKEKLEEPKEKPEALSGEAEEKEQPVIEEDVISVPEKLLASPTKTKTKTKPKKPVRKTKED